MPDGLGKIPPWAWGLGAVGTGVAIWYYKKQKAHTEEVAASSETATTATTEEEPYPVLPYSPEGYGGGLGGGAIGSAGESQAEFHELFGQQQTFEKEEATAQQESQRSIAQQIKESEEEVTRILSEATKAPASAVSAGSGGGAPSNPAPGGATTVQAPATQPSCPSAFPNYNPARGAVGANSCWRWSRTKTPAGCSCHGYQSGALECEKGKAPHCAF